MLKYSCGFFFDLACCGLDEELISGDYTGQRWVLFDCTAISSADERVVGWDVCT